RYLVQPGGLWLLLQRGEGYRGFIVANALVALGVGIGAQAQCPVVDIPRAPERLLQDGSLSGRRVAPIAVCALPLHACKYSRTFVRRPERLARLVRLAAPFGARRFIPMAKPRGLGAASFDNLPSSG